MFYQDIGGVKVYQRMNDAGYRYENCNYWINDKGFNTKYAVLLDDSLQILDVNMVMKYQNDSLWRLWLGDRIDSVAVAKNISRVKCGTRDYYCLDLKRDLSVGLFQEAQNTVIRYFTVSHFRGVWEEVIIQKKKVEVKTDTLFYHQFTKLECMGGRPNFLMHKIGPRTDVFLRSYVSNFEDSLATRPHRIRIDSSVNNVIYTKMPDFKQQEDIEPPENQ